MALSPIMLALVGAVFVVVFSGLRLTRSGRPFSSGPLNLHKLVDLAVMVGIGAVVFRNVQVAPLSDVALTATGFVAALQLLTLLTGGMVAASKSAPSWITWAHRVLSWPALLMTVWWGVLFLT
jgi:hypothetical protein